MKKLRLDYFLSLGLKLVEGDKYEFGGREYTCTSDRVLIKTKITDVCTNVDKLNNLKDGYQSVRHITSFAPRKNTGTQPCGDDVPVAAVDCGYMQNAHHSKTSGALLSKYVPWAEVLITKPWVESWRPAIDELIKMQGEHDKAVKMLNNKPQVDEKCRIEYSCPEAGKIISDFTFKFETAADYTGLDKFGNTDVIPKRWFIAWHPIDERSELDIAKEAQVALFSKASRDNGFFVNERYIKFMQDQGMLADIALGFETND